MKKYLLFLVVLSLLFSCNFSKREPTEKQKEFAQKVLETPGVLKVEWTTTSLFKVWVRLEDLGPHPKLKAKELADQLAAGGASYTGESLCASIFYPEINRLADSCASGAP